MEASIPEDDVEEPEARDEEFEAKITTWQENARNANSSNYVKLRLQGYKVLPRSALRILLQILAMADMGSPATIDKLKAALGTVSHSLVHSNLKKLRDAGLIEWRRGSQSTIYPSCRAEMIRRPPEDECRKNKKRKK